MAFAETLLRSHNDQQNCNLLFLRRWKVSLGADLQLLWLWRLVLNGFESIKHDFRQQYWNFIGKQFRNSYLKWSLNQMNPQKLMLNRFKSRLKTLTSAGAIKQNILHSHKDRTLIQIQWSTRLVTVTKAS